MRPRFLIVNDLSLALGSGQVARDLGVSEVTERKYREDPDRSGLEMPLRTFEKFISIAAGSSENQQVQRFLFELMTRFCELAGGVFVRHEGIRLIEEALKGNGFRSQDCPACGNALKRAGVMHGQPVYVCENCHGVGRRIADGGLRTAKSPFGPPLTKGERGGFEER